MNLLELKEAVFTHTPILKKILQAKGKIPLRNYFEESLTLHNSISSVRKEELLSVVKKIIDGVINPAITESALTQLRQYYYVSTADHHGPITHPFFVNSHLAQSFANSKHNLKNIFVFSCAGISLNNSSFPRGILFHDQELKKKRIRFVSLKDRHHPVFAFPAYKKSELESRLHQQYSEVTNEKIKQLIEQIYLDKKLFSYTWYSDQISQTNYYLWKQIPGQESVNLIYLEQENIVRELLLQHHLHTPTLINRLLTDESILEMFEKYFDGIQGAFSSTEKRGTILFWTIHEGERKQLRHRKKILETNDGSYQIALDSSAIREALEKKELMPSMALSFIVLSFYYGITCGGGFLQVNYLTQMKEAYVRLLKKIGELEDLKSVESIKTDFFCGEFVFATLGNKNRSGHASSIDLMLYENKEFSARLQELSELCTLGEAVDMMMPNFYKILYGTEAPIRPPISNFPPSLYV